MRDMAKAPSYRHEAPRRPADDRIVRDVLGDPVAWPFCISDDVNGIPDLHEAIIRDVFVAQQRLFLYLRGVTGSETVAVFFIDDQDLRERTAEALRTGSDVAAALQGCL